MIWEQNIWVGWVELFSLRLQVQCAHEMQMKIIMSCIQCVLFLKQGKYLETFEATATFFAYAVCHVLFVNFILTRKYNSLEKFSLFQGEVQFIWIIFGWTSYEA